MEESSIKEQLLATYFESFADILEYSANKYEHPLLGTKVDTTYKWKSNKQVYEEAERLLEFFLSKIRRDGN